MAPVKKILFTLMAAAFLLSGCKEDTTKEEEHLREDLSIAFQCEQLFSETGDTLYGVYAVIEDYKIKLAETNPCEAISPDRFGELQIPSDALAAVGGKTEENSGAYFYAERESGQLLIYQQDTLKTDYQLIATFQDGNFHFIK